MGPSGDEPINGPMYSRTEQELRAPRGELCVSLPEQAFLALTIRKGAIPSAPRLQEVTIMPRVCHFTGRHTVSGWTKAEKGKRRDGGVGNKVKGRTKRMVKPNLRKVKTLIDGKVVRVYASTKAIKSGLVVRPVKVTTET